MCSWKPHGIEKTPEASPNILHGDKNYSVKRAVELRESMSGDEVFN